MRDFQAGRLIGAFSLVAAFGQFIVDFKSPYRGTETGVTIGVSELQEWLARCNQLLDILGAIELDVPAASVRRALSIFQSLAGTQSAAGGICIDEIKLQRLHTHIRGFTISLADQMEVRKFLSLSNRECEYFQPSSPLFGLEVDRKFSSVAYDISEAGKCLALERSTASVFHSLRCLEAGIAALSRCLQIPDPTRPADRTWGKVLGVFHDKLEAKWPKRMGRLNGDAVFFEDAHAALSSLQNPWRNATMHLEKTYTQEEARHRFEVVKGFITRLANRCDEDGKPFA